MTDGTSIVRKQPQDHKKSAAQIEVEGDPTIVVAWRDFEFTVPAELEDWPIEVTLAFEDGKATNAVRLLLGAEQWGRLVATRPRNKDINSLFEMIAERLGLVTAGN
jgi:hypothetical protein